MSVKISRCSWVATLIDYQSIPCTVPTTLTSPNHFAASQIEKSTSFLATTSLNFGHCIKCNTNCGDLLFDLGCQKGAPFI